MSQDDPSSRENQRPPSRSRSPWVIGVNIAAGLAVAGVVAGISLSTQHAANVLGASAPSSLAPTTMAPESASASTAASAGAQFSFAGASMDQCSDKGTIRSTSRGPKVSFAFENNTATILHIIWINYQGSPVSYGPIPPGQTYGADTAIGNVWEIASASSSCPAPRRAV